MMTEFSIFEGIINTGSTSLVTANENSMDFGFENWILWEIWWNIKI